MTSPRIAIIGGGLAGVTAAWQLAQSHSSAAVEVTLYEASDRLGGILETVHAEGFTIECGPDSWVTEKPWARELAEELGLRADLLPSNDATRKTYILKEGKLLAMPDGMRMMVPGDLAALDASSLFSAAAKHAFHAELARADELKATAPPNDESVASFVLRHFGQEVLDTIGAPLLSGVFGGDVETLSVRAVMPAFVRMEREHGSLIRAVQSGAARQLAPPPSIFTTLRPGLGSLIDAMVAALPPHWLRLQTPITTLARTPHGWSLATGHATHEADAVLLATPIHVTSGLLHPIDSRAAKLTQMDASSAVIVAFGFPETFPLPPGFGFLVPPDSAPRSAKDDSLLAATFVDQKFPGRAPNGGRLLRAFFGGPAGERMLALTDAHLVALARRQLDAILGPLPEPTVTVVRRWPRSLPQYAVGHLDRMTELDARVRALGGLWLLGNGYCGVGLPDIVRDARAAARAAARECLSRS